MCQTASVRAYIKILDFVGAGSEHTGSINQMFAQSDLIEYLQPPHICTTCLANLSVERLRDSVDDFWEGLCLDCMRDSSLEVGAAKYWLRSKKERRWDTTCRIKHGYNTWYFSSMAHRPRREK
jgi:hypothetical protein